HVCFNLVLGVLLQVCTDHFLQRIERFKISDLASERVIEWRRGFALYFVECDANGLGLTTLGFIREIVRPFDWTLDRFSGSGRHDQLFDSWNRLTSSQHEWVALALSDFAPRA